MEQNTNQEKQTPAPKKGMSKFRKALLWTAIPIIVLSVAGLTGVAVGSGDEGVEFVFGFLWIGAVFYFLGAIIALIGFAIKHERQKMAGILAGLGISIVSLGATCFAMISTGQYL
jgi:heme/copper-type cytochrome/quinol oxidase subunit 2